MWICPQIESKMPPELEGVILFYFQNIVVQVFTHFILFSIKNISQLMECNVSTHYSGISPLTICCNQKAWKGLSSDKEQFFTQIHTSRLENLTYSIASFNLFTWTLKVTPFS